MRRHVPNLGTRQRASLQHESSRAAEPHIHWHRPTERPIHPYRDQRSRLQKSRRIHMEPCGFELIDYIDFSLPLEHAQRSEEHTSELQSRVDLVCRLLLEKKKKNDKYIIEDNSRL